MQFLDGVRPSPRQRRSHVDPVESRYFPSSALRRKHTPKKPSADLLGLACPDPCYPCWFTAEPKKSTKKSTKKGAIYLARPTETFVTQSSGSLPFYLPVKHVHFSTWEHNLCKTRIVLIKAGRNCRRDELVPRKTQTVHFQPQRRLVSLPLKRRPKEKAQRGRMK